MIGGGAAGENCADRAGRRKRSVALVEAELVGGECSYWACMPSKALLRPGEVLAAARRVPGAAGAVTGVADAAATLSSRDAIVHRFDDSSQVSWLEGVGVTLVRGRARLDGPKRVVVRSGGEERVLVARAAVVLATGSVPIIPPVPGLAEASPWSSREVTSTKEVPRRLIVLGGGVVACEMAQAMRWLGAEEVTIVERGPRLVAKEEPFVHDELLEAFTGMGIDVRLGAEMSSVRRASPDSPVTCVLADGSELVGDELLVATGRRANTADLGVETVGLEPGKAIEVDDKLRATDVEGGWLYAVGDVNGKVLLTHMGKYQARIAGDHICGLADVADRASDTMVPRVMFTDPQLAAVGMTEAQAGDAGLNVRSVRYAIGDVAGAAVMGDGVGGTAQLVVDEDRRTIVGATFTGPAVGELLHAATVAMAGGVTVDQLWHAVPSYPTVSEVWLRLLETYGL